LVYNSERRGGGWAEDRKGKGHFFPKKKEKLAEGKARKDHSPSQERGKKTISLFILAKENVKGRKRKGKSLSFASGKKGGEGVWFFAKKKKKKGG